MTKQSGRPPGNPRSPRAAKPAARPTRAQVQAMEARTAGAANRPPQPLEAPVVAPLALDFATLELPREPMPAPSSVVMPPPPPTAAASGASRMRRRVAPQVVALSREQEYAYIRADMQRLLSIAGGLCALMLVLLLVLGR